MTSHQTTSASYEVGYRKPPRRTQFKKGQSGNPGGRPRGRVGRFQQLVLQEAYRGVIVMERGVAVPMPAIQAVLRSQFELAASGNVKAQRAIVEMIRDLDQEDGPEPCGAVSEDDGNDGGGAGDASDDGGTARPDDDRRREARERDAEQPPVERWRQPPAPEPPPPPVRAWRDRPQRPGADLRRAWRESGGRDRW